MIIVNNDLLKTPIKIIAHQVNCQGVMGGGVAKQIKQKYPRVYEFYKAYCCKTSKELLGDYLAVWDDDHSHLVVNIFGQDNFGRDKVYTDYKALENGFDKFIKDYRNSFNIMPEVQIPIAIPYKIGCGLAGGDWGSVSTILDVLEIKYNIIFIAYKLD